MSKRELYPTSPGYQGFTCASQVYKGSSPSSAVWYKDYSGWTQNKHMLNTCDEVLFLKRNRIFLRLSLLKVTVKMQSH